MTRSQARRRAPVQRVVAAGACVGAWAASEGRDGPVPGRPGSRRDDRLERTFCMVHIPGARASATDVRGCGWPLPCKPAGELLRRPAHARLPGYISSVRGRQLLSRPHSFPGVSHEDHDRVLHRLNVRAPRCQSGGGDSCPLPRRVRRAHPVLRRQVRGGPRWDAHFPEIATGPSCPARRGVAAARGRTVGMPGHAASGGRLHSP